MARSVETLLKDASKAGIEISLRDDNTLGMKGDGKHPLVSVLRENRTGILVWLDTIRAIENRMINGRVFLVDVWKNLIENPDDEELSRSFSHHLHLWASLDDDLRNIYGYEGCPVGGCDRDPYPEKVRDPVHHVDKDFYKQPLVCSHCAEGSGNE